MTKTRALQILSYLAILEGISYLLFAVSMPLKYVYHLSEPNYIVGMIHGLLFIGYCLFVLIVARAYQWQFGKTMLCLAASLLPIATFIVDSKILRKEKIQ